MGLRRHGVTSGIREGGERGGGAASNIEIGRGGGVGGGERSQLRSGCIQGSKSSSLTAKSISMTIEPSNAPS